MCDLALAADARRRTQPAKKIVQRRTAGEDWPRFLGPTGDNKSSERGILTAWPAAGPPIVWQLPLGTGYGSPTISQGRLFQFDRKANQARLRCWRARPASRSGSSNTRPTTRINTDTTTGRASPVVDEDRVYMFGAEGMLHCLAVDDGKPIWKVDTTAEFGVVQNFFGVGSTPVVSGDLLIVQVGGSTAESSPERPRPAAGRPTAPASWPSTRRTGQVKYRLGDELASYASPALAKIDGRAWCFVFARGGLLGFDPGSGKLDFHFPWRARSWKA